MPTISYFYGIKIEMYFIGSEHNPPHIHAYYQSDEACYMISTGEKMSGNLPRRAERLVQDFIELHKEQLMRIWDTQVFEKVEPLR